MGQYLLATHAGGTDAHHEPMPPERMQEFMQAVIALEADMDAAGAFVFGGRLADPHAATVVSRPDGAIVMTDGPFVETKEHIAGFYILEADDLDQALEWAERVVTAIGAPIEVRPFLATGRVADQMPG